MNSIVIVAAVILGALALFVVYESPSYAQGSTLAATNGGSAVDSVVSAGSSIPLQLVRRGGGMGHSFRGGHARGFRHFSRGAFFIGGGYYPYSDFYYSGCGEGCYQEGNKTCVWNGYNYRCYTTSDVIY